MTFFLGRALPTELVLYWPFNYLPHYHHHVPPYHPQALHPRSWAKKIATMDFHQMLGTWRKVKRRKAQSLTQKRHPKTTHEKMMGTFNFVEIWVITPQKRGVVGVHGRDPLVFSFISLVIMTFCGPLADENQPPHFRACLRNLRKQKQSRQAESSRDAVWNQWREDFPGYRLSSANVSLVSCAVSWKEPFFLNDFYSR